jgi:hypothetical protein
MVRQGEYQQKEKEKEKKKLESGKTYPRLLLYPGLQQEMILRKVSVLRGRILSWASENNICKPRNPLHYFCNGNYHV